MNRLFEIIRYTGSFYTFVNNQKLKLKLINRRNSKFMLYGIYYEDKKKIRGLQVKNKFNLFPSTSIISDGDFGCSI